MARSLWLWLAALVMIGCGATVVPPSDSPPMGPSSPTERPTSTPSASPTLANPVLQMTVYEFPSPATLREPPEFSLYSDGHAIYLLRVPAGGFELRHARLDPQTRDTLLANAVDILGDALPRYDDVEAMHQSTTVFDVETPQLTRSVWVYALGEDDDGAPSAADRARLAPLREGLLHFDEEVEAAGAVDLGGYEPDAYLVELSSAPDELPDRIAWPWPALDVDDFVQADARSVSRVMSAPDLADVLPEAGSDYLIATAPGGGRYVIYLTPQLPGESSI